MVELLGRIHEIVRTRLVKCVQPLMSVCPVLSGAFEVNCSEPTQPALLKALAPVFNMSAIRPVVNMTTCTNISTYFTLYGILGVVSSLNSTNTLCIIYCMSILKLFFLQIYLAMLKKNVSLSSRMKRLSCCSHTSGCIM